MVEFGRFRQKLPDLRKVETVYTVACGLTLASLPIGAIFLPEPTPNQNIEPPVKALTPHTITREDLTEEDLGYFQFRIAREVNLDLDPNVALSVRSLPNTDRARLSFKSRVYTSNYVARLRMFPNQTLDVSEFLLRTSNNRTLITLTTVKDISGEILADQVGFYLDKNDRFVPSAQPGLNLNSKQLEQRGRKILRFPNNLHQSKTNRNMVVSYGQEGNYDTYAELQPTGYVYFERYLRS